MVGGVDLGGPPSQRWLLASPSPPQKSQRLTVNVECPQGQMVNHRAPAGVLTGNQRVPAGGSAGVTVNGRLPAGGTAGKPLTVNGRRCLCPFNFRTRLPPAHILGSIF